MRRTIALWVARCAALLVSALLVSALLTLATHVAFARVGYKRSPSINTNVVMTYTFPITETGVDSLAFEVNGLCSVVYESAGSDDASLYAVPTSETATGSGTLIVAYTASSTAPTVFQPGTRWVRAVAVSAVTGGSIMRITCSNSQMASTGEACGTSGLVPYVGTGGRYKCEPDLSYDETNNALSIGGVAGKSVISMDGNSAFTGTTPTGAAVILYPKTDGDWYMENATSGERRVTYVSAANHFDVVLHWGVQFEDVTAEYGGSVGGGPVASTRFCMGTSGFPRQSLTTSDAATVEVPLNGALACANGAAGARPDWGYTLVGDPFIKSLWCDSSAAINTLWVSGDQVGVKISIWNGPEADEANIEVATLVYGFDELVTEHGAADNNLPLRVDIDAFASSFFTTGGPYAPGEISMAYFRVSIETMLRDAGGTFNTFRLKCALGLELRE